jgi:hypothetical protein
MFLERRLNQRFLEDSWIELVDIIAVVRLFIDIGANFGKESNHIERSLIRRECFQEWVVIPQYLVNDTTISSGLVDGLRELRELRLRLFGFLDIFRSTDIIAMPTFLIILGQ